MEGTDPLSEFPPNSGRSDASPSPSPSRYSSCGESDAERYCCANSAMGTPSLCSSLGAFHECLDSELGSVKSFGPGEICGLENLSLGGRFVRRYKDHRLSPLEGFNSLGDYRTESCERKIGYSPGVSVELYDNNEDSSCSHLEDTFATSGDVTSSKLENGSKLPRVGDLDTDLVVHDCGEYGNEGSMAFLGNGKSGLLQSAAQIASNGKSMDMGIVDRHLFDHGFDTGSQFKSGFEESPHELMVVEQVGSSFDELNSKSCFQLDEIEAGRLAAEDGMSSMYEHSSEGEDSMYNCGADDEHKYETCCKENTQCGRDVKTENGSILAMNSSIAFGSEDWDDFVIQTGDGTPPSALLNNFQEQGKENLETEMNLERSTPTTLGISEKRENASDILLYSNQVQATRGSDKIIKNFSMNDASDPTKLEHGNARNKPHITGQLEGTDDSAEYLESCSVSNIFETKQDSLKQDAPSESGFNIMDGDYQFTKSEDVIGIDDGQSSESQLLGKSKSQLDPLSKIVVGQVSSSSEAPEYNKMECTGNCKADLFPLKFDNNKQRELDDSNTSVNFFEDQPAISKVEDLELNPFYDEVVHDMEEILLDVNESPGARFHQPNIVSQSHLSTPSRNSGSTASTSGTDAGNIQLQSSQRIDGVELVGAKQRKGDVSLGERLVGVKEYTVYILRVWSGKDQWEIERRYRDFFTLHRRLKSFYADQGWSLPSPWSSVERESRKIFGSASPDIVAQRSAIIQECLQSILHSRCSPSLPSALILFLSPEKSLPSSPASNTTPFSIFTKGTDRETVTPYGKTISLIVEIRPHKSIKQMLELQHYTCAGCHKYLDDDNARIRDFVRTFGWGKPRLCEYTGQLFCSSCHSNDTAVLPARVLHHWDFTQCPVSQLAKSYLDSIQDQPMLCVSAVNPFLFSKVPALFHVMGVRKSIVAMLPNVRCPFRRSIHKGLGSRRYLLESNDFFALRDLVDLSKGAFAVLPIMVETVSRKILEHITEHCLICCDVGVPCGARQACDDPSSLIFPFQEGEVEKCRSCSLAFHIPCFKRLTNCPCGARLNENKATMARINEVCQVSSAAEGTSDLSVRRPDSKSPVGFLSGLFSEAMHEKIWGSKKGDNVILMGSLPSTSL